jgi:MarR family transcriptional regulator, organic hydroperoxide resistance regulator
MPRKLVLHDFLPYLLNRAGVRVGSYFSREIERFGATLPMWRVLIALWSNGDDRLGGLSARTSIENSTLSRLLVAMQRKGLIVRRRSNADGRALRLTLTPRGRRLTERIIPIALHYEDVAMRGLSAGDCAQLKLLLAKVYDNLAAAELAAVEPEVAAGEPAGSGKAGRATGKAGAKRSGGSRSKSR